MATYLFAWNPRRWQWDNLDQIAERVRRGEEYVEPWSLANRNAGPGDRAFLIRLGQQPRGIVASGTITTEPHLDTHWDPEKTAQRIHYVDIAWDTLLNSEKDDILHRERLDVPPLSEYRWDTQSSGVLVPDDIARELERIWSPFARKGGLVAQIIEAFKALGGIAQYADLYDHIQNHATTPLPRTWKDSVRARIEERSSDSESFKGKEDLFYSVEGLGRGVWGLRSMLHSSPPAPDTGQSRDPARRALIQEYRIIRDTKVTRQLKTLYQDKCQICGTSIPLRDRTYSEAHHIRPLGEPHNGPDIASNVIVVCPNHHAQLDYGALAIDPDSLKILSSDAGDELLNKELYLHPGHRLVRDFLKYHLEIYERRE